MIEDTMVQDAPETDVAEETETKPAEVEGLQPKFENLASDLIQHYLSCDEKKARKYIDLHKKMVAGDAVNPYEEADYEEIAKELTNWEMLSKINRLIDPKRNTSITLSDLESLSKEIT